MPAAVAAAVFAESIGAYVAGSAIGAAMIASTSWISYAGITAVTSFAVGSLLNPMIGKALHGGGGGPQPVAQAAQARQQMIRSPVAVRQIIYGRCMTSGALVFAASSADNNTLHMVIACAGHEVEAIDTFYLNDKAVGALDGNGDPTGGDFAGLVTFKTHLGASGQTADSALVAANVGWTNDHRLRGIAYVYVKLTYDQSKFPTGIPNIRCVVRGKKLYDPRTTLTAYSNNSALVAYDYLTSYIGATAAELDAANWIAQANICDEAVALASASTESRYTANGVIQMDARHRDAMQSILSSCGGAITCPEGKYRLNVAAYTAPVIGYDEDILRGPLRVRAAVSKKELYNAVKGSFVNPDNYWQASDFPPVTNSTYATADGGEIFQDIQLPFTTSSPTAQRLARIMLEKSRQGITVDLPCKLSAIEVRPYENITLTIDHLGWSSKVFKVIAVRLSDNGGVDMTLQEEASACYDWSAQETTYDLAIDTNLPDPFSIAAPGNLRVAETLYETTGSVGVRSKATLSWDAPADAFVVDYEVEYKLHSSGTWIEVFNIRGTQYEFYDLAPGVYDFRIKSRNIMGVVSAYTPTKIATIYGLTAAPANVSSFSVRPMAGLALATWDRTADLDVKIGGDVVLRWSPLTTGATWEGSVILPDGKMNGDASSAVVPLATGTYFAKFVDSTGHYSDAAASFVATEAIVTGWATVATTTQHTAFSGSKTNLFVDGGTLKLDNAILFDDAPGYFDDAVGYFDSYGGVAPSGEYLFDATVDLTTSASRRFHAHIRAVAADVSDLIGARGLVSTWPSVSGAAVNDCDAKVYASVSDDDLAYSGWMPFMVADFKCRYARFKALLTSGNVTHNIAVSELSVSIKEPA